MRFCLIGLVAALAVGAPPRFTLADAAGNADLTLQMSAAPNPVPAGAPLTYSLSIQNNGPATATDVTVTDALPPGLTFVSAAPSQGSCTGRISLSCDLGSVENGKSATLTIQVMPGPPGIVSNQARVSANETDLNPADNAVTIQTTALAPTPQALTLTVSGDGSGRVWSWPLGLDCATSCSASFPGGSLVSLSATPASGSSFAGWQGACSGTGACTVTLGSAVSLGAQFSSTASPSSAPAGSVSSTGPSSTSQVLTVSTSGSGSGAVRSIPTGIDCTMSCSASYAAGSRVTLSAVPASGSSFSGWGGACTGMGTCTLFMGGSQTATANFTRTFPPQ